MSTFASTNREFLAGAGRPVPVREPRCAVIVTRRVAAPGVGDPPPGVSRCCPTVDHRSRRRRRCSLVAPASFVVRHILEREADGDISSSRPRRRLRRDPAGHTASTCSAVVISMAGRSGGDAWNDEQEKRRWWRASWDLFYGSTRNRGEPSSSRSPTARTVRDSQFPRSLPAKKHVHDESASAGVRERSRDDAARPRARPVRTKLAWKPHPKSMSLGVLALHIAGDPGVVRAGRGGCHGLQGRSAADADLDQEILTFADTASRRRRTPSAGWRRRAERHVVRENGGHDVDVDAEGGSESA